MDYAEIATVTSVFSIISVIINKRRKKQCTWRLLWVKRLDKKAVNYGVFHSLLDELEQIDFLGMDSTLYDMIISSDVRVQSHPLETGPSANFVAKHKQRQAQALI